MNPTLTRKLVGAAALLMVSSVALATPAENSGLADCVKNMRLKIGGSELELRFKAADFALDNAQICAWTERSAMAVASYFDGFPVPAVRIVFRPNDSDRIPTGSAYGFVDGKGPMIFIELGRRAGQAAIDRDWVLTHEMTHLAVPSVPEQSRWLEEGIATYVEPIARAQLGQLSKQKVWADMVDGLPNGLPRSGDRGLDRTPTWGRTYWGGALFCLLADVQIRERTGNRMGLRDALRGVIKEGGNIEQRWSVQQVMQAGDRAVGVPVLSELYAAMATQPGPQKLETLWARLGVSSINDRISFAEDAPLAAVRDAITAADAVGPTAAVP